MAFSIAFASPYSARLIGEDVRQAHAAMLAALVPDALILPDPAPSVVVTDLAASSVSVELRFWIRDASLQGAKKWEYLEKRKYALDEAGVQTPYPHLQVFVERTEAVQQVTEAITKA